jgi:hypothetical protein
MIARKVGELQAPRRVTHGKDPAVGRAQPRIHRHSAPVIRHACGVKVQTLKRYLSPDGYQQVRPRDRVSIGQRHGHA